MDAPNPTATTNRTGATDTTDGPASPWDRVFALIESFEDGLALMTLFENEDRVLRANGISIEVAFAEDGPLLVGERALAERIAEVIAVRHGGDWSYTHFYTVTRGLAATPDEVWRFIARCRTAGVELA